MLKSDKAVIAGLLAAILTFLQVLYSFIRFQQGVSDVNNFFGWLLAESTNPVTWMAISIWVLIFFMCRQEAGEFLQRVFRLKRNPFEAIWKPEDSDELKDARNRLKQEIAAALRVKTAGEMLDFTRGLQGYVRRRFIPEFAQQLSFAHGTQTGSVPLNLIDRRTRDKIVSTLEEMARSVKEEHLTPSMSSLPPHTSPPFAKADPPPQPPSQA